MEEKKKLNKFDKILIIISIVSFMVLVLIISIYSCGNTTDTDKSGFSTKYKDYQIENMTVKSIKYYYPLLYPDTFKMKTCKILKSLNKDNFELWKVSGYFTAESKYGLEIKKDYFVSYRYYPNDDELKIYWVYVDGTTYYKEST